MYSVGWVVVFIWLGILTFSVWQQQKFLISLFPKEGNRDIRRKFEELLLVIEGFKTKQEKLESYAGELRKMGLMHISRVELLRYNPYEETGGDQSFTIAMLNEKGSGFVLTSLHARSGTRVFGKPIEGSKSSKYKLSKEEEAVIKKAMEK